MFSQAAPNIPNSNSISSDDTPSSFSSSDHLFPPKPRTRFYHISPRRSAAYIQQLALRIPRRPHFRRIAWSVIVILQLTAIGALIWLALIVTVANRLRIPHPHNGLSEIVQTYSAPNATHPASPTWLKDFSNDLIPVQCHSHNDYWHRVPLYEGLAAGCVSTEADIWIGNTPDGQVDLFVGHSKKSLSQSRTLRSLYLDPLVDILTHQNSVTSQNLTHSADTEGFGNTSLTGVFSMAPDTSLVLLLDFKITGEAIWTEVVSQLDGLRSRGWLTYWTPAEGVVQRPITIVGSGDAPFDAITANTTYRDIFYDAPLTKLSDVDTAYNSNNSYYASTSLSEAVGMVMFGSFTSKQKSKAAGQVQRAEDLGLKSRYWDTPGWPVGWRNRIWEELVRLQASVLNADDLTAAARWDWEMCVVAGVNICNK
ncbi:hypothetical protein B7463_g632, partial [Scytalidium lignicola]